MNTRPVSWVAPKHVGFLRMVIPKYVLRLFRYWVTNEELQKKMKLLKGFAESVNEVPEVWRDSRFFISVFSTTVVCEGLSCHDVHTTSWSDTMNAIHVTRHLLGNRCVLTIHKLQVLRRFLLLRAGSINNLSELKAWVPGSDHDLWES